MAFEIIKLTYLLTYLLIIFMAALRSGYGHYILSRFFLPFFLFSFFFPRLISAVADWMSTILLHVHMV